MYIYVALRCRLWTEPVVTSGLAWHEPWTHIPQQQLLIPGRFRV